MSDPLSITASVAGLVSLGVQVVSGLTQYLDAVRERKDDIAKAKKQVLQIQEFLRRVEDVTAKIEPTHSAPAAFLKTSASITVELQALEDCVRSVDTANVLFQRHGDVLGKVSRQVKKLTYPFHRPTMDRLQSHLERVNTMLQAALQVSVLDVAIDIERSTSAIETKLPDMALGIDAIRPLVQDTGRQLAEQFRQEAVASRHAVLQAEDSVASLSGRFDQGKVEIQEAIAAATTTSVSVLRREYAEGQTRMFQELAVSQSGVSGLGDTLSRVEMALRTLPTREELGRLVSKPGQLKELCDIWERSPEETASITTYRRSPVTTGRRSCICRKRQTKARQVVVRGSWRVLGETTTSHDHDPDCVFHIKGAEATSKHWAVVFTGLQGLISRAIEVSFSYSFGAGGASLSPNFTYYPSIDRRRDPAFRIMGLMNWAIFKRMQASAEFMELCIENLILLYRHGKASPQAVDLYGRSILHYTGFLDRWLSSDISQNPRRVDEGQSMLAAIDKLVEYGGNAPVYDIFGSTPAWSMNLEMHVECWDDHDIEGRYSLSNKRIPGDSLSSLSNSSLSNVLCSQLAGDSIANQPVSRFSRVVGDVDPVEFHGLLQRAPATAEACQCGPLSLAALEGNWKKMDYLLANYPNTIHEVNALEQTPLHLAVGHSSCVALLLQGPGRALINVPDVRGRVPMEYALYSCTIRPKRRYPCDEVCENRGGETSLRMLLEADSKIPSIASWPSSGGLLQRNDLLCDNCVRAISPHLVDRRERLKQLAIEKLPRLQATALDLFSPSVLDVKAIRVIRSLEERGISVPTELQVLGSLYDNDGSSSFWHHQGSMPLEVLWSLGFRDLDTPDARGHTPLLYRLWNVRWGWRSNREGALGECSWLIENGADLWKLLPEAYLIEYGNHRGSTAGHGLYSAIAKLSGKHGLSKTSSRHIFDLTRKLSQGSPRDGCQCACSPGGCTPFVHFLRGVLFDSWQRRRGHRRASKLAKYIPERLNSTHASITTVQMRSAIRYATFQTLGIRHTCRCYDEDSSEGSQPNEEELDEIRQEDRLLIDCLEDLVRDFEVELEQMHKKRHVKRRVKSFRHGDWLSRKTQHITRPRLCWHGYWLPRKKQHVKIRVRTFFSRYWLPRMEQVLESIEGSAIDESDKAAAEDIGVVWQKGGSGEDKDSYGWGVKKRGYHESDWDAEIEEKAMIGTLQTMDDWMSRLELIMSKAGLPIKIVR